MKDNIREGTVLLMKEKDNLEVCKCPYCRKFAGKRVTFLKWAIKDGSKIKGKTPFTIKEGEKSLFFENVEKVITPLPEHLFEI